MKNCGIYQIENIKNHKIYIGSSINLNRRKIYHFSMLRNNRHCNIRLQNSFNKHGEENFKFTIIEYVDINKNSRDEILRIEQFWIDKFATYDRKLGFNMSPVTKGSGPHTKESKKKISIANKGHRHSEETKRKISKISTGRKLSKEQKEKIGKSCQIKVLNVTTGEIFNSIREAARRFNISNTNISHVCLGKSETAGGYSWEYLNTERKEKANKNRHNRLSNSNRFRKIINITTGEVFEKINDAVEKYNLSASNISATIHGKQKSCGGFKWGIYSEN